MVYQLAIDLGTGNPTIGLSNLTLSLAPPLLRGGGGAVPRGRCRA